MLTARQQEIWGFLVDYVDRHGYPPTVRDIVLIDHQRRAEGDGGDERPGDHAPLEHAAHDLKHNADDDAGTKHIKTW